MLDEPFTGWAILPAESRTCSCFGKSEFDLRLDNKSRMNREIHVRFCEGPGVRFPRATRLVILCRTADEAARALELVQRWVTTNGLTLHPTKTKIVDVGTEGFDFLGYHFRDHRHWPREKSQKKLKDTLRTKTKRNSGQSLKAIIVDVNRTLVGWFEYFKHGRPWIFGRLDGWLRGRLRSPRQNTTTMLAGLFAASVSAVLLGVSKILVTDFAILMLLGAGWEWGTVARGNSLQLHVPEAIAGRMVGFYYLVTLGVNALGALLLGVLFTHLGVDPSTMLVGVVVLVLMLGLALTRRAGLD